MLRSTEPTQEQSSSLLWHDSRVTSCPFSFQRSNMLAEIKCEHTAVCRPGVTLWKLLSWRIPNTPCVLMPDPSATKSSTARGLTPPQYPLSCTVWPQGTQLHPLNTHSSPGVHMCLGVWSLAWGQWSGHVHECIRTCVSVGADPDFRWGRVLTVGDLCWQGQSLDKFLTSISLRSRVCVSLQMWSYVCWMYKAVLNLIQIPAEKLGLHQTCVCVCVCWLIFCSRCFIKSESPLRMRKLKCSNIYLTRWNARLTHLNTGHGSRGILAMKLQFATSWTPVASLDPVLGLSVLGYSGKVIVQLCGLHGRRPFPFCRCKRLILK